jgi:exportin-T
MIDEEVADVLYTSTKKPGDQQLNTDIKDRIRIYDVQKLTGLLLQIMVTFQSDDENEELVRLSLGVIGQWIGETCTPFCCWHVAWIDINLIVNDTYMSVIYQFLGHPYLRTTASETLAYIVSKKMGAADKLQLITFLNLTQVVNSVGADEDVDFSEAMAKLVNMQGIELTRILVEVPVPSGIQHISY